MQSVLRIHTSISQCTLLRIFMNSCHAMPSLLKTPRIRWNLACQFFLCEKRPHSLFPLQAGTKISTKCMKVHTLPLKCWKPQTHTQCCSLPWFGDWEGGRGWGWTFMYICPDFFSLIEERKQGHFFSYRQSWHATFHQILGDKIRTCCKSPFNYKLVCSNLLCIVLNLIQ